MPTGEVGTTKLPVLVWGNGGCSGDGTSNRNLLENIASYGYLAIASGAPKGTKGTTAAMMKASIDWAVANAGKGAYANVDASKIMAAGFSCGGVEANAQIWDPRVATIGIFSSGLLTNTTAASTFKKPILYVIGGSSDVAYQNVSCAAPHSADSSRALTPSRPSATSRPSPRTPLRGRVTSRSGTAARCSTPTAAPLARPASTGSSGSSGATPRPPATLPRAIRLTTGRSRRTPWTSLSRWSSLRFHFSTLLRQIARYLQVCSQKTVYARRNKLLHTGQRKLQGLIRR
jgi:hypothetical protein